MSKLGQASFRGVAGAATGAAIASALVGLMVPVVPVIAPVIGAIVAVAALKAGGVFDKPDAPLIAPHRVGREETAA